MDYDGCHSQEGDHATVPSDARRKMIESAVTLLAVRGLQRTSFSDVLERSGAPRGSIYHHFPAGKDQLVDAAIARWASWTRSTARHRSRSPGTSWTSGARCSCDRTCGPAARCWP